MPDRSKWLQPARIAHGLKWRTEAFLASRRHPDPQGPPLPSGNSFQVAVLESFGVADIDELDPTQRMWAEFTLTSVERGWHAIESMGGPKAFRGKRVLDVGSAYGGFLVAAGHAGARTMVGIDVDEKLLDLARLLFTDHGVSTNLEVADITDPQLTDRLGGFDLILCNDVLEHVVELDRAAQNLGRLLNPGGRLFLEIPNGLSINYISSDGHYKLPGITLLDHADAERWFRAFYESKYPYRTFFYAPLDYYLALFSRHGVALTMLNTPTPDPAAIAALDQSWSQTFDRLAGLNEEFPDKPVDLIDQIQRRSLEVDMRIRRLLGTATGSAIGEERMLAGAVLRSTFGTDAFLLEGRRVG
ncbi:MAG: class I SAM-dependent methyltransferase [Acidimicrobiia bacterium]|nr:class I SAM-dependent methyltransferase [Acidimicrobiia bacterium]